MDFDFSKGGEDFGRYYPALKPISEACKQFADNAYCSFYQYEPGNGTRYDVIFSRYPTKYGIQTVMTIANMGKSMILSGEVGMHSLGYMKEKLNLGEGDCYALIPLINHFYEVQK